MRKRTLLDKITLWTADHPMTFIAFWVIVISFLPAIPLILRAMR